jgi:hypothetical protein
MPIVQSRRRRTRRGGRSRSRRRSVVKPRKSRGGRRSSRSVVKSRKSRRSRSTKKRLSRGGCWLGDMLWGNKKTQNNLTNVQRFIWEKIPSYSEAKKKSEPKEVINAMVLLGIMTKMVHCYKEEQEEEFKNLLKKLSQFLGLPDIKYTCDNEDDEEQIGIILESFNNGIKSDTLRNLWSGIKPYFERNEDYDWNSSNIN